MPVKFKLSGSNLIHAFSEITVAQQIEFQKRNKKKEMNVIGIFRYVRPKDIIKIEPDQFFYVLKEKNHSTSAH